jgi:hypothetical protein
VSAEKPERQALALVLSAGPRQATLPTLPVHPISTSYIFSPTPFNYRLE